MLSHSLEYDASGRILPDAYGTRRSLQCLT